MKIENKRETKSGGEGCNLWGRKEARKTWKDERKRKRKGKNVTRTRGEKKKRRRRCGTKCLREKK